MKYPRSYAGIKVLKYWKGTQNFIRSNLLLVQAYFDNESRVDDPFTLDSGKAGVKNGLYFFLLDREILRGMKLVGLDSEAVGLFHDTIRKQLKMDYERADYEGCLGGLFTHTTRELFEMGRKFEHK